MPVGLTMEADVPLEHSSSPAALPSDVLAYVAGFFDGEGCVNFTTRGKYKSLLLRVMVRNTDRAVIDYLQSLFGGRIETKMAYPGKPHWKTSYCWRIDGAKAVEFLLAIEPWVRIKREQIWVAQAWEFARNKKSGSRMDDGYRDAMRLLTQQLAWLNRKGKRRPDDRNPVEACVEAMGVPLEQIWAEVGTCH